MKSRKYSRVAEEIFLGTAVSGIILTPTWPVSMTAQNSDLRTGARMPGRRIKETAASVCVPGEWHPGAADGAAGRSASSQPAGRAEPTAIGLLACSEKFGWQMCGTVSALPGPPLGECFSQEREIGDTEAGDLRYNHTGPPTARARTRTRTHFFACFQNISSSVADFLFRQHTT